MKFTYVGPHDAVELVGVGVVARGKDIEVPNDLVEGVQAQPDNWKPAKASAKTPAATDTEKES